MVSRAFRQRKLSEAPKVDDLYDKLGKIGEGTYGVVFKARRRTGDKPALFALKGTKVSPGTSTDGLSIAVCREIALLKELRHENVIYLEQVFLDHAEHIVWLLFDYAEYDVWGIIAQHRAKQREDRAMNREDKARMAPESLQKSLMWQILNGIHYLHSNWILHRDLKPANILVMGDGEHVGVVKIADMGMARLFHSPLRALTDVDPVVVTFWYRSPEVLLKAKHYTKAVDIWAIGCIMAELMMSSPIFHPQNTKEQDKSKDPYHKDQLSSIFSSLGLPRSVSAPGTSDRDWLDLDKLPGYQKFLEDFGQRHKEFAENKLEQRLAPYKPPGSIWHAKLGLLNLLLKMDPTRRITAKQALQSPYFEEEPRPTMNAFARLPEGCSGYKKRSYMEDKDKEGKSRKHSTSSSSQPQKRARTSSRSHHDGAGSGW